MTTADKASEQAPLAGNFRSLYLDTLLQRLLSPGQAIRHYALNRARGPMVGLSAEIGVRDVLRSVLPERFGVTSGFLCDPDGSLIVPPEQDDVSPQTDVIVYDASRSCPLYKLAADVAFVAIPDAVGIIEVKDRDVGEAALGPIGQERGALKHVAILSKYARDAFRVVVLIRGGEPKETENRAEARDKCAAHIAAGFEAPHVIYCAEKNYVGVYEYLTNKIHFVQYRDEGGAAALADFLRVTSSFYAAQGLSTTSISSALGHESEPVGGTLSLQLPDRVPLPSLWDKVAGHPPADGTSPSVENRLKNFADTHDVEFFCVPTTGKDSDGRFTSGIAVVAIWKEGGETKKAEAASFFTMQPTGLLECVPPPDSPVQWLIAHERPETYLQRVCGRRARMNDPFAETIRREDRS